MEAYHKGLFNQLCLLLVPFYLASLELQDHLLARLCHRRHLLLLSSQQSVLDAYQKGQINQLCCLLAPFHLASL